MLCHYTCTCCFHDALFPKLAPTRASRLEALPRQRLISSIRGTFKSSSITRISSLPFSSRQIHLDGFTIVKRKQKGCVCVCFSFNSVAMRAFSRDSVTDINVRKEYSFHGDIGGPWREKERGKSFLGRRKSRLIRLLYVGFVTEFRWQPGHYIERERTWALLTTNKRK